MCASDDADKEDEAVGKWGGDLSYIGKRGEE